MPWSPPWPEPWFPGGQLGEDPPEAAGPLDVACGEPSVPGDCCTVSRRRVSYPPLMTATAWTRAPTPRGGSALPAGTARLTGAAWSPGWITREAPRGGRGGGEGARRAGKRRGARGGRRGDDDPFDLDGLGASVLEYRQRRGGAGRRCCGKGIVKDRHEAEGPAAVGGHDLCLVTDGDRRRQGEGGGNGHGGEGTRRRAEDD